MMSEEKKAHVHRHTIEITESSAGVIFHSQLIGCICLTEIVKKDAHRWKVEESMVKIEDKQIFVRENTIG